MRMPNIPLFDWLIDNISKAKYDLANSSITGVPLAELQAFTGFKIPKDFNLGLNDPFGFNELRESLAKMYNCDKENVVTTTGGSEANFLAFFSLLEPGDEVIVEQPGYSPLWLVPETLGARIVYWKRTYENRFSLNIEDLKSKVTNRTKFIVITNLHNPSGVLANQDTIHAIAEIAADHHALLFIDEMYLDATEEPQHSAAGIDSVIVTASISKVYGIGGLRTGWIIAPKDIAERCLLAKWQTTVAAPYLSEMVTATALSQARDKLIERCKSIARRNYPIVKEWIETHENLIDWVTPAGGILCFPRYHEHEKMGSEKLCQKIVNEKGVLVSPGKYFGLDGHFRLTYLNPESELRTSLAALTEVLSEIVSE